MNRVCQSVLCAGLLVASAAQAVDVDVRDFSAAPWLGFMNVFELPSNGGGFVFGSPWGIPDLVATFNDPSHVLTLSPNVIGDPNPFWYIGGGGPGAPGNKIMEANLYVEVTNQFAGETVTFSGTVLSSSFTAAHEVSVFIRDFAPDYSSRNEAILPLTAGPFTVAITTDPGAGRHVQWGFQVRGVNVWTTDTAPFGNMQITTVPAPVLCVADVDDGSGTGTRDGGVTIDDLLYYLGIFESGVIAADVDDGSGTGTTDGGVTIDDLLYYLFRFEAGC